MRRGLHGVTSAFRLAIASGRKLISNVSISTAMLLLVGVALSGYAVFGVEYYMMERAHRALLTSNSTYIEFEDYVRSAATSLQVASFAVTSSKALSEETVRSAAADFFDAALAASDANKVPALKLK